MAQTTAVESARVQNMLQMPFQMDFLSGWIPKDSPTVLASVCPSVSVDASENGSGQDEDEQLLRPARSASQRPKMTGAACETLLSPRTGSAASRLRNNQTQQSMDLSQDDAPHMTMMMMDEEMERRAIGSALSFDWATARIDSEVELFSEQFDSLLSYLSSPAKRDEIIAETKTTVSGISSMLRNGVIFPFNAPKTSPMEAAKKSVANVATLQGKYSIRTYEKRVANPIKNLIMSRVQRDDFLMFLGYQRLEQIYTYAQQLNSLEATIDEFEQNNRASAVPFSAIPLDFYSKTNTIATTTTTSSSCRFSGGPGVVSNGPTALPVRLDAGFKAYSTTSPSYAQTSEKNPVTGKKKKRGWEEDASLVPDGPVRKYQKTSDAGIRTPLASLSSKQGQEANDIGRGDVASGNGFHASSASADVHNQYQSIQMPSIGIAVSDSDWETLIDQELAKSHHHHHHVYPPPFVSAATRVEDYHPLQHTPLALNSFSKAHEELLSSTPSQSATPLFSVVAANLTSHKTRKASTSSQVVASPSATSDTTQIQRSQTPRDVDSPLVVSESPATALGDTAQQAVKVFSALSSNGKSDEAQKQKTSAGSFLPALAASPTPTLSGETSKSLTRVAVNVGPGKTPGSTRFVVSSSSTTSASSPKPSATPVLAPVSDSMGVSVPTIVEKTPVEPEPSNEMDITPPEVELPPQPAAPTPLAPSAVISTPDAILVQTTPEAPPTPTEAMPATAPIHEVASPPASVASPVVSTPAKAIPEPKTPKTKTTRSTAATSSAADLLTPPPNALTPPPTHHSVDTLPQATIMDVVVPSPPTEEPTTDKIPQTPKTPLTVSLSRASSSTSLEPSTSTSSSSDKITSASIAPSASNGGSLPKSLVGLLRFVPASTKLMNSAERITADYWTAARIEVMKQVGKTSKESPMFSKVRLEGVHSALCTLLNESSIPVAFQLRKPENTIGREDRDIGLFKLGGTKVSRLAATIHYAPSKKSFQIVVHGKHGLSVNGVHQDAGSSIALMDGDEICLATLRFIFRIFV